MILVILQNIPVGGNIYAMGNEMICLFLLKGSTFVLPIGAIETDHYRAT